MFTGLIQTMGRLERFEPSGKDARLTIRPQERMVDLRLGESIAINGVCLTLEKDSGGAFSAYVSAETLSRSTLGQLRAGAQVNLERALALGDRLGGHFVSGHVDCLAEVQEMREVGESRIYRLRFSPEWSPYVVPKGSVALDGVSLTINDCGTDFLEVNSIPATRQATTIGLWSIGSKVNLETDLIAKYVQRLLGPWQEKGRAARPDGNNDLSLETLQKHGFF